MKMKRWMNHEISTELTIALGRLNWQLRRVFAIIGIFAMLGSMIPNQRKVIAEMPRPSDQPTTSSEVAIAYEDISMRTATEKVFRKIDGTYEVAIYNEPIHYLDNGQWKDIDNTLSLDTKTNNYMNRANQFTVQFPASLEGNKQIQMSMGNYSIDWSILNISKSSISVDTSEKTTSSEKERTKVNQSVLYRDVLPNVDLEYVITGMGIKENLIIQKYVSSLSFAFQYQTKDLEIQWNEAGKLVFVNHLGETLFAFEDLYMVDAKGDISTDIRFDVKTKDRLSYQITIIPDDAWLKEATYPVILDPSLSSTTTNFTIYDTYINEAAKGSSYDGQQLMYIGGTTSTTKKQGLIMFTIPSGLMNQSIMYAHLAFTKNSLVNGKQINLYKNNSRFSESATTWNNAPSFNETSVIDYYIANSQTPMKFDITEAVKEWQAEGISMTPGFRLVQAGGYGDLMSVFQVYSGSSSSNPIITIGYQDPSGLKDYWTYTSQNMGRVGTGYISDYTGNLTWVRNEYNLNHEYLPLTLSFFYNTATRNTSIGYGNGWRTSYNLEVKLDSSLSGKYYLLNPDGGKIFFNNETVQQIASFLYKHTYVAEDGSRMILERFTAYGQTTSMTIQTVNDIKYNFSSIGRLTSIDNIKTDHNLWVYYLDSSSQKIDYVKDEANNVIDFIYDSGNNRLVQTELQLRQSDTSLRSVEKRQYFYDSNSNLDYIQCSYAYISGANPQWQSHSQYDRLEYYFGSNNRLIEAYDNNNQIRVEYTYDSLNRVTHYALMDWSVDVGSTSIVYDSGRAIYTNYEKKNVAYTFDQYGHTVNFMDDDGYCMYYRYSSLFSYDVNYYNPQVGFDVINWAPNYYNVHRLIEKSDVLKQQQNPINNHGFEEGNTAWTLYSGGNGTVAYTQSEKVLGYSSLALTTTSGSTDAYQSVFLKEGGYMITAWIKNAGTSGGAYVDVLYEDWSGTISKVVNANGWVMYTLVFVVLEQKLIQIKLINESISTAYFDNISVSEGFVETRYNAVNNNSFEEDTSFWTMNNASVELISETGVMGSILGEKAVRIIGSGTSSKTFTQDITSLVESGETLMVGGWAKADAVPNKLYRNDGPVNDGRYFGLIIEIDYYEEGNPNIQVRTYYLPFLSSIEEWQFQMRSFEIPDETINQVRLIGKYKGEGTAFFDNIQLYHDKLSTFYGYNSTNGNLTSIQKSNGSTTEIGYDSSYHVTAMMTDGQSTTFERTGTYQIEEIAKNNVRTMLEYNATTKQLTAVYVGYNKNLPIQNQDKWFKTSTFYTSDGQYVNAVKDEFGNVIQSTTDQSVGLVQSILDAMGNSKGFTYNAYGELVTSTITKNGGGTMSATYHYDDHGRLTGFERNGFFYYFVYNDLDQLISVQIANTTAMTYDYVEKVIDGITYYTDLLQQQTYGNGDYVTFAYDKENRVQSLSFNGTTRFEYMYDSSGRLSIYKDIYNANIYFYSYDLLGRLKAITDKDDNEITYAYDALGNVSEYVYTIGTTSRGIEYHYNSATGVYDYARYVVGTTTVTKTYNYETDSLKRLNNIALTIGTVTLHKYLNYDNLSVDSTMGNATSRILSIVYTKNGVMQSRYTYAYDANQNITGIVVKNAYNQVVEDYDYYYDGFNQLVRENVWINSGAFSRTYLYFYDSQGNITSIRDHAYTTNSQVTSSPIVYTVYEYSTVWTDQLIKMTEYTNFIKTKEISYTYDQNGNPTQMTNLMNSYQTKSLSWDGRQLNSLSYYCTGMSFKYNDQGLRTRKTFGGCSGGYTVNYVLDGSRILSETKGTSTIYYTYDADGTLISMNYQGNEYFYITNLQGDVVELVDINGNSVVQYKYDAWGAIIYQTPNQPVGDANPFRYRSYYFDSESGWYYLQSRFYDPLLGRFISADGLAGQIGNPLNHNMYAYCANNPVNFIDPEGESLTGILLLILVSSLIGFSIIATTPLENVNPDNISVSVGGSTDSFVAGAKYDGIGLELQVNVPGSTCNIAGECSVYTMVVGGQVGPFGGSYTTNEFGGQTLSLSFLVFNLSFETSEDFSNWSIGAGLSFSKSAGLPFAGGGSVSYDIDFLGLIVDSLKGKGGE